MKKFIFAVIILLSLFSCSSKGGSEQNGNFLSTTSSISAPQARMKESTSSDYASDSSEKTAERKLIVSVDIRVNSKDVEKSYKSIEEKLKEYNGYFDNVESSKNRYHLTIRIPKENLYAFIDFIEQNEKVENKNINTQDVTETYYDTENRIKNREVLLEKLRNYLREARNIDEILKVEDRINTLTYEIETMKGNLKNLQSSVDYSRVTLNILNPEAIKSSTNIYNKYLNLISFLKAFFSGILFFLVGFTAAAIPIVLILALFYYICFGKIGLIKKLYNKIK
ncbi:DUF4349 domain-containing protein [Brachyspira hampsonii]|uniref:DUF4349 domain-containing protein n=1 Tax=Brachyspira hampsonii TaxID=1287055 RepID=A0AAC9XKL7_9SPIR|nr:DUF4349 domain-containing protein [Brachyspira hampsonii]ASJ21957.1 hypothetical protein BHAMNSH16_10070 [Brachyspira hampsonii]ELV04638.1 hypothetical protein H263_15052 [Brachyspira hampsonii 30599]MBW5380611.1 DUF4349 domain-containing protein [Brachyspira hampsonii]OEJ19522.1 hypothetical protein A9496_03775 [Brachyspira hampsonii]